jgi:hypothetical protein
MKYKTLKQLSFIGLITLFAQNAAFAENLNSVELDEMVKEDIASAQVLLEICPASISGKPEFKQNIEKFTESSLKRLSNPSTTFAQLQQDATYKAAYADAKSSSSEVSKDEQKTECENILTLGHELDHE